MNVDNENKPYGTRNEAASSQYTERKDIKVEPYATQKTTPNYGVATAEIHPTENVHRETTYKQQTTYPQEHQTRVQRGWSQYDTDLFKNPVVATLLGLSLALFLMSLSHFLPSFHLPRLHWGHSDKSLVEKDQYDYQRYGARDNDYWRDRNYDQQQWRHRDQWRSDQHPEHRDSGWRWFGRGRDSHDQHYYDEHPQSQSRWGRWFGRGREQHPEEYTRQGAEMMNEARDKASGMYQNAKDSIYDTAESVYEKARDNIPGMNYMMGSRQGSGGGYYPSSNSWTDEASRQACNTAERVRDYACGYNTGSQNQGRFFQSGQGIMDNVRQAGERAKGNARYAQDQMEESRESIAKRASELYEAARKQAGDVIQAAKETVTYPVNAAMDTAKAAKDAVKDTVNSNVQSAKDTVRDAKDSVQSTGEAANSRFQAVKDTVTGAAESVKEKVAGVYETVKEHTPGFGSGSDSTSETVCTGENCKNTKAQIKVEVREV